MELAVYKEGFEVVNDLQREVVLKLGFGEELNLFLCRPARCTEERLSFYRIAVEPLRRKIEEQYRRERHDLEAQELATAEELGRLKGERDQAKATVERLIEELAQLKPGQGSALYRRAAQLVSEGKPDEALAALDAAKLLEGRALARAQKEEAEKELEEVAEAFVLRGQLLALKFQFDEAEVAYQEAIETAPKSVKTAFNFAFFLAQQKRFSKAVVEYERCLSLARERGGEPWVGGYDSQQPWKLEHHPGESGRRVSGVRGVAEDPSRASGEEP